MTPAMRCWVDANLHPVARHLHPPALPRREVADVAQPPAEPLKFQAMPIQGFQAAAAAPEGAESTMASGRAGLDACDLDLDLPDFDLELGEDMMGDLAEGMSRL